MKGVFSNATYSESDAITALWKLICTGFILLMVVGFTLIEYGGVRRKNSKTVLAKNILVVSVASIGWWLAGYGLSYADVEMFMGSDVWYFASLGFERMARDSYLDINLEFAYVAVAVVIFTIPLAERATLPSYVIYSFILSGFVYPSFVAWVWGGGWLQQKGFHDFAGAGVIHMTAGVSGLCGTIMLGKRQGLHNKQ
jgi:Amt family ammonium transporter